MNSITCSPVGVETGVLIRHEQNYTAICITCMCMCDMIHTSLAVRALEAAKALGSTESAEEILQAVAEKVEGRQRQQQTKASSTVRNS